MRCFLFLFICALFSSCNTGQNSETIVFANNPVIAHRGAWKAKGFPENSIAALRYAIELNCTGSEFDVRMTKDNILIVTHDADYKGLIIEENTYDELAKHKLSNGEKLPTLRDYIEAGMKDNDSTGMVCEIKPSRIKERSKLMAEKTLAIVKELGAESYMSYYISFGYGIIQRIKEIDPKAKVLYLNGSKNPQKLKTDNIDGLDYYHSIFKKHPNYIEDSKELGLKLNAWTVNKAEDIDWLLANGFDYITTNEPELVFERMKKSPTTKGYKLVWSDEFSYSGKPDSLKWNYEIGFKRNQEKQYYTNRLENARVEKGYLVIESRKETIENTDYLNQTRPNWISKKPYADYTSASLTTKDLADWTYGRIDINAKLPEGIGLWPAFWMLGQNWEEIGWPKCGEIDIMEHVGFDPDSIFGTIHSKAYNHMKGTQKGKRVYIEKPYDKFHTYSLVWTPADMSFLLDGKVYNRIENENTTTDEWPFNQDFHLKINVAVGGMLGGRKGIDDTAFPNKMLVNYVRVFQKQNES
ncbi:glycerophosphodiester phosphodiesterase family protein [Winogradskyella luteola]|uniref:Family 16 glycosylhydrolase n=1 Tax=Winogradskyella luteola TaxID=2828330 RepID=A0A9X1F8R1_9FLAO|nr:family 16 glycosylhydrolase [Winogradskyella luteola]MBV7269404.1 family 16 glycosylhydrolase [Winogradskyella luteola]